MRKTINRKKILIGVTAAVLAMTLAAGLYFFAGRDKPPTLQEVVSDKFAAYETDLRDSLGSLDSNEDVARYLVNWAENKGINYTQDIVGNVIYQIDAAEGCETAEPVVIVCNFDAENMAEYVNAISAALTAAKNPHSNGPFKVIFSPESGGRYAGIEGLSQVHFADNAKVFYLDSSSYKKVSEITGGFDYFRITDDIQYHAPEYDTAYRISIRNVPSFLLSENIDETPNPIKVLGQLIADFQSTSLLFELADFSGGSDPARTPADAEITIVIESSYIDTFEKKMQNTIEKFTNKYGDDFPYIEYTFEKTELPSQVLKETTSNNIVGFMYTVIDGVYSRDRDGTVVALTNMGCISTSGGTLQIDVAAMSCDEDLLAEIHSAYQIISGLCDVKFTVADQQDIFTGGEKAQSLATEFQTAFEEFGDSSVDSVNTAEFTPCTFLADKNENMSVLYCSIDERSKEDFAGALITFMEAAPEE